MTIDKKLFEEQRRPRFGNANPERMQVAFWEWMIRGGASVPASRPAVVDMTMPLDDVGAEGGIGYWPWDARRFFKMESSPCDGPIWTFQRYGVTQTEMPDGRTIRIGGEHEDSYDPDFWIYNDVVVFARDGQIEMYGYPEEAFRPTDFHTATRIRERIFIIGGLDYVAARRPGHTRAYVLDTHTFRMSELETSGEMPEWIYKHEAELQADGTIRIRNGICFEMREGRRRYRRNTEEYSLNIQTGAWKRETNRNWSQFTIRHEDRGLFVLDRAVRPADLIPRELEFEELHYNHARFVAGSAAVQLIVGSSQIEIIIEKDLQDDAGKTFADSVRASVEAITKRKCVVD